MRVYKYVAIQGPVFWSNKEHEVIVNQEVAKTAARKRWPSFFAREMATCSGEHAFVT